MEELLHVLIWGGTTASVVALAIWVRRRARRPIPQAPVPPSPPQLLEESIARVRDAFRERIPAVETACLPGSTYYDPVVMDVWFVVAQQEMEDRLRGSAAYTELDQAVRVELGRSGYVRQTVAMIMVGIASRERLDRDGWRYYYP